MQAHIVPCNRHHPAILRMEFVVNVNVRENVDDIRRVSSVLVAQLLHGPTAPRQLSCREGQDNAGRII